MDEKQREETNRRLRQQAIDIHFGSDLPDFWLLHASHEKEVLGSIFSKDYGDFLKGQGRVLGIYNDSTDKLEIFYEGGREHPNIGYKKFMDYVAQLFADSISKRTDRVEKDLRTLRKYVPSTQKSSV